MTSSSTTPLVQAVTYHAWNKDLTQIALSPNNHQVHIYKTNGQQDNTKWEKIHTLDRHGGPVSGIDWSAETNQIVTCGHDRNAYVWKYDDKKNEWQPTLVILRINRAATSVKWSPAGNKFAVSSGAKCVPVCHFEASNDWWISKMIKKHKSTVLSLAWCVNNKFIVTGSADMKCRVFSAYMEGIDPAEDDGFGEVWSKQHEFGEVLCEFDQAKAWVHSVAWSPQGFRLAFAGHGSTMHFVQILAGSEPIVSTLNLPNLPFIDIAFLSDNAIVAAGYDMNPAVFEAGGSEAEPTWHFKEFVDKQSANKDEKKVSAFGATQNMFKDSVSKGHAFGATGTDPEIWTKHKNIIMNVQIIPDASGSSTKFTTSGIDGRVIFWDVSSLKLKA